MIIFGLDDELSETLLASSDTDYAPKIQMKKETFDTREKAFRHYMNQIKEEKHLTWKTVAERIGFSQGAVYKIISFETPIRQRDKIIRIGFGMDMTIEEIQKALQIYGFSRLYVRNRRDALIMKLFMEGIHDIREVDQFLKMNGEPVLQVKREKRQ